jgi:membrane-bound serine protease (ClpP class)
MKQHLWRWLLGTVVVLVGIISSSFSITHAQNDQDPVFVIPIHNEIDLGLVPFLERVLNQAEQENAQAVILDINTPGGRLDAVLQMRDAILSSPIRTIAFVNREAFSAGALIAIAAEEIYMTPGAVMGAATPVDLEGTPGDEKTISAVRATFRTTAEHRGRDPLVAEAMVDPSVIVEGLVTSDQLLTLTTQQAQDVGYIDGVAENRQALLAATGLTGAAVQETSPNWAETVVRFLTSPLIASLLVSLGFLLILGDVMTGGFGLVGGAGILLFVIFFWGHFLAGLAGWEGVLLMLLGLGLIAAEVFFIPGFGIAGIAGIAALLGGVFISLIGDEIVTDEELLRAGYTVALSFLMMAVGTIAVLRYLPQALRFQGLILQSQVGKIDTAPQVTRRRRRWIEGDRLEAQMATAGDAQTPVRETPSLAGKTGVALSDLRPGGIAQIGGERVDVVTRGDYVRAGTPIEVIRDEGYRRVVRRLEQETGEGV